MPIIQRCYLITIIFIGGLLPATSVTAGHHKQGKKVSQPSAVASSMTKAAQAFLDSLGNKKASAQFPITDAEFTRWHFFPTEMHKRKGANYRELNDNQKALCQALLATGFSELGVTKINRVRLLEDVLTEIGKAGRFDRDGDWYFLTIFGNPGDDKWGWRFEGHHLSLHMTLAGGKVVSTTPSFMGSNPGTVPEGKHKGLKVLAAEEDLARELAKSLTKDQKGEAIIAHKAPKEILSLASRAAKKYQPLGMPVSKFDDKQIGLFYQLVNAYIGNYHPALKEKVLKQFKAAGSDKIHFAWAGGFKAGEGHYYRIQTPDYLIEYDNVQKKATHAHTVFRELKNDFGDKYLTK